ncbi:MAG: hypothetical protein GY807_20170 [Gammaproteobacteria bacterium]|nr:hypothetical protein [Gammaproteobacteria bacterium]
MKKQQIMSPTAYTEDTLVQQTTADYLEQQLGWKSVYACNEDFGPINRFVRDSAGRLYE